MTTETDTVNKFVTAFNKGDIGTLDKILAADFKFQMAGTPQAIDKEGFIGMAKTLRTAFPDWQFANVKIQSAKNPVKLTVDTSGTHQGPLDLSLIGGTKIGPTGKRFKNAQEPVTFVVENGKITKHSVDSPEGGVNGMLDQLGIQPPTPSR